jgi:hypothetical protein
VNHRDRSSNLLVLSSSVWEVVVDDTACIRLVSTHSNATVAAITIVLPVKSWYGLASGLRSARVMSFYLAVLTFF